MAKELEQSKKDRARANAEAAKARRDARNAKRGGQEPYEWAKVDGQQLTEFIDHVTRRGGAVMLGLTRDKGALVIKVYHDVLPMTEYVRPSDDLTKIMILMIGDLCLALGEPTPE